jgi:ABC-type oligopeptide transport system substrate-binding subunit
MKRSLVAGAALLALFAMMAFTSCKGTAVSSKAKTLVYGTTDKVTDMDTASAYDAHTWDIFQNVAQGLLAYTPAWRPSTRPMPPATHTPSRCAAE